MIRTLTDIEVFNLFIDLINQREIREAKNFLIKNPEYIATIIDQIEQSKSIDKKKLEKYNSYIKEAQYNLKN